MVVSSAPASVLVVIDSLWRCPEARVVAVVVVVVAAAVGWRHVWLVMATGILTNASGDGGSLEVLLLQRL